MNGKVLDIHFSDPSILQVLENKHVIVSVRNVVALVVWRRCDERDVTTKWTCDVRLGEAATELVLRENYAQKNFIVKKENILYP